MKKMIFLILFMVGVVCGQENYEGWLDTSIIVDTLDSATIKYGSTFRLSPFEAVRLVCLVNDTGIAGLGSDSINFSWGYQTGSVVMDSTMIDSAKLGIDTAWDDPCVLDTLEGDNAGTVNEAYQSTVGVFTRTMGSVDSLNITGFLYQSREVGNGWDVLIRGWVKGLGDEGTPSLGQTEARALLLYLVFQRRVYSPVRRK